MNKTINITRNLIESLLKTTLITTQKSCCLYLNPNLINVVNSISYIIIEITEETNTNYHKLSQHTDKISKLSCLETIIFMDIWKLLYMQISGIHFGNFSFRKLEVNTRMRILTSITSGSYADVREPYSEKYFPEAGFRR